MNFEDNVTEHLLSLPTSNNHSNSFCNLRFILNYLRAKIYLESYGKYMFILPLLISCFSSESENTNSSESLRETIQIHGEILEECNGIIMIDVMGSTVAENKPVFFTKAEQNGSFSLEIPIDHVSQVHAFCYPSSQAIDQHAPTWKTTPKQIHPSQIPEF